MTKSTMSSGNASTCTSLSEAQTESICSTDSPSESPAQTASSHIIPELSLNFDWRKPHLSRIKKQDLVFGKPGFRCLPPYTIEEEYQANIVVFKI